MLREQIKSELITAMKAKDEAKTSVLRMIGAALKDKDIAARPARPAPWCGRGQRSSLRSPGSQRSACPHATDGTDGP